MIWLALLALVLLAAAVSAHHIPGGDAVSTPPCHEHGWDCLLRDYEHAADKAA